jgi:hypothetical protein
MSKSQTPIGDRRTFFRKEPLANGGLAIGVRRTFSLEWMTSDGFPKPSMDTPFSADKAMYKALSV